MHPLYFALAGLIAGWLLKTATDLLAELRANKREDVVWRRQHPVDAIASYVHASRQLTSAETRVSRAVHALGNAQSGHNSDIIGACRTEWAEAVNKHGPWAAATIQALETARLYAPDEIVEAADVVWDTIQNGGQGPEVREITNFEQRVFDALQALRRMTRATAKLK